MSKKPTKPFKRSKHNPPPQTTVYTSNAGGSVSTSSMMWTTPFVAKTSFLSVGMFKPFVSWMFLPFVRSDDETLPNTTWYSKIAVNCLMFSGLSKLARVPAGNFSKALLVGAKTVKGPAEESIPVSLAASRASTNVDKLGVAWANCTMFLGAGGGAGSAGIRTISMMCTTPFDALTLGVSTVASLIITLPPASVTFKFAPSSVVTFSPFVRSDDKNLPDTTWYVKIAVNCLMFLGLSKLARVPAGNFRKALLFGAKTVKGPAEESVPVSLAASRASAKVDKVGVAWANSTMFFLGGRCGFLA